MADRTRKAATRGSEAKGAKGKDQLIRNVTPEGGQKEAKPNDEAAGLPTFVEGWQLVGLRHRCQGQ